MEQVLQGVAAKAAARVHRQRCGFVHDDQGAVLMQHADSGGHRRFGFQWKNLQDLFPGPHAMPLAANLTGEADKTSHVAASLPFGRGNLRKTVGQRV